MANILIYKRTVFNVSETFIYKQVLALTKNNNVIVAAHRIKNMFPVTRFKQVKLKKSFLALFHIYRIIKKNKISIIHAHYGPDALDILNVAKFTKTKLVVSFHGYDASSRLRNPEYLKKLPGLFNYASIVIVCSRHMIKSLQLENKQEKIRFVPYGIDADFFKPTVIFKDNNSIDILHSGRVVEKKGVADVIKVFNEVLKKHQNIKLHIVGAGNMLDECKALADELKIPAEKIIFYGAKTPQEVQHFMNMADIFILNSRTAANGNMEGLPNSILEAMSMEKPVISTYHAGIPDAITTGYNGLLVNEYDNDSLQNAVEELVNNKEKRIEIGRQARKTVLEKFTEQKMQHTLQQIFSEL